MRIGIIIRQNWGACEWYRILLPLEYLKERLEKYDIQIDIITERLLSIHLMNNIYDLIILSKHSIRFLSLIRLKSKAKIIFDIDDDYTENNTFREYIRNTDNIMTTNERLKKKLIILNKNVVVFENSIPYKDERFKIEKTNNIFNIGYLGYNSHQLDIEHIKGYNKFLFNKIKNYNLTLYGYTDNRIYNNYIKNITDGEETNFKLVDTVHINDFFQLYQNVTVSIAPLINSDFNISKSNLKFSEAALSDTFFIGSNISTYSDIVINNYNGFLANNVDEFVDYTVELYHNKEKYSYILENAKNTIYKKLDFYKIQEKRFLYLMNLLGLTHLIK